MDSILSSQELCPVECAVLTQGWDSALLQDVKGLPSLLQQDGQEHERLKEIGDNCHAG